jgi:carbon storage regulator CsrA
LNCQRKDAVERFDISRHKIQSMGQLLRRHFRFAGVVSRGMGSRAILFSVKNAFGRIHGGFAMLVLSRKSWESVVVGDPARAIEQAMKVTVLEIGKDRVRLGFEVADHIPVHRWEVWERLQATGQNKDQPPERARRIVN